MLHKVWVDSKGNPTDQVEGAQVVTLCDKNVDWLCMWAYAPEDGDFRVVEDPENKTGGECITCNQRYKNPGTKP